MRVAVAALVALLLIAGCGGDAEEPETTATTTPTETQPTATEETVTEPEVETATEVETEPETAPVETETSPEDQPGGAGDEEPARSLALFARHLLVLRGTVVGHARGLLVTALLTHARTIHSLAGRALATAHNFVEPSHCGILLLSVGAAQLWH